MRLIDIYKADKTPISFEIFPPKDDLNGDNLNQLYIELERLKEYNPSLISVTYGAGGSNKEKSYNIVKSICEQNITVMPHFTCVCSKKEQIDNYLNQLKDLHIENILALRGDEPKDITVCYLDFRYANELVSYLKEKTNFSIAVAGYPEGHINAPDLKTDIKHLKNKLFAGGNVIFTQMFFDNEKLFRYKELLAHEDINVPVVAGILPIRSYSQLNRMLSMAKVTLPVKLMNKLEKFKDNSDDIKKIGIDFAIEQCNELIQNNISGLHFYTLNKSDSVSKILDNISY